MSLGISIKEVRSTACVVLCKCNRTATLRNNSSDFTHPRSESLFRPADVHVVHDSAPERHVLRRRLGGDPPRADEAHLERKVLQTGYDLLVEEALEKLVIHLQSGFKMRSAPHARFTDMYVGSTRFCRQICMVPKLPSRY